MSRSKAIQKTLFGQKGIKLTRRGCARPGHWDVYGSGTIGAFWVYQQRSIHYLKVVKLETEKLSLHSGTSREGRRKAAASAAAGGFEFFLRRESTQRNSRQ